uniref:Uncharacterized protein n=1 Tax=Amorphochlora amoebiformis TaxID=1561963 RepID=A0A7S0H605_9EUKA|mmetsp:Transcript_32164/g.51799  ORF Transcript_32164/g.51799 Transcript_32164/m.51799 type:complete len:119 (+) Transcript_32164:142-498(+)
MDEQSNTNGLKSSIDLAPSSQTNPRVKFQDLIITVDERLRSGSHTTRSPGEQSMHILKTKVAFETKGKEKSRRVIQRRVCGLYRRRIPLRAPFESSSVKKLACGETSSMKLRPDAQPI